MKYLSFALLAAAFVTSSVLFASPAMAKVDPVSASLCVDLKRAGLFKGGNSLTCERFRVVNFNYWNFDRQADFLGEVVVLDAVAAHVEALFEALFQVGFPLGSAVLPMACNEMQCLDNTIVLDLRPSTDDQSGQGHSYGVAIAINPAVLSTGAGVPESIAEVFASHGFIQWGGDGGALPGPAHFSVGNDAFIKTLISLSPEEAKEAINKQVSAYRRCMSKPLAVPLAPYRRACVESIVLTRAAFVGSTLSTAEGVRP